MLRQICLLAVLASASAFAPTGALPTRLQRPTASCNNIVAQVQRQDGENTDAYNLRLRETSSAARMLQAVPSAAVMSQFMMPIQQAAAANGELGLLEGKGVALAHPLIMAGLYLATLYTGYQGLKWREVRTMGADMQELQAQVKALEEKISAAAAAEQDASADQATLAPLKAELDAKTASRKEMMAAGYRDKHWAMASTLLALGVTFSVEGGVDTYMRVGKLFPGPHLFAGAGITVLWAVAAALVPKMQKGEEWARTAHIGINVAILGLFTWQLPTGFDILTKVWSKVPWVPVLKVAEAAANAPK